MPRFLADGMLGRLARDLRMLGYDAAYGRGASDAALRRWAARDGRILLTQDRELAFAAAGAVLVDTQDPDAALAVALGGSARPDLARFLTRCLECNATLEPLSPQRRGESPTGEGWTCPVCRRAYWEGTHVESMRRRFGGP